MTFTNKLHSHIRLTYPREVLHILLRYKHLRKYYKALPTGLGLAHIKAKAKRGKNMYKDKTIEELTAMQNKAIQKLALTSKLLKEQTKD